MNRTGISLLFALLSGAAHGAGFYLSEVATPHSLGTAGVANPTNTFGADTSWSNPAGMTYLKGDQISAGMQLIVPNVRFDASIAGAGGKDGDNAGINTLVPGFFYVKKHSERVSLGFSITGSMGGGLDYGSDFVGRYQTMRIELSAVGLSPSIAYKVSDRLSIGGGVSVLYTLLEEDIALSPAITIDGKDGRLKIEEADDIGYQPFFSLNYEFSDDLLLGVVYRAKSNVELEGDVKIENVAVPPGSRSVDIEWDNPDWLEAGLKYKYTDQDIIFLNAGWQNWSTFSKNRIAYSGVLANPVAEVDRNWRDTWHAGIAYSHVFDKTRAFSLGFAYDSSPVKDKDRTFDLPADETYKLSAAYGWEGKKALDFAVGGTLYMIGDAEVDKTVQGVRVRGEFEDNLILFIGGTLRYAF